MTKSERKLAVNVLVRAKARIQRGWCQRTYARDAKGVAVFPESEQAVEWCLSGSIDADRRSSAHSQNVAFDFLGEALKQKKGVFPTTFNDSVRRKKEDIVKLLSKAIQIGKKGLRA
jgi:hypothetical protein